MLTATKALSTRIAIRKLWRFTRLYGMRRTLLKVAGRLRSGFFRRVFGHKKAAVQDIAMVGCGQFAFATIGYFVGSRFGGRFATCYDVRSEAADSFASFFSVKAKSESPGEAISRDEVNVVYIASNHASHSIYAIEALSLNKTVYVEKPVSVTWNQFADLANAVRASKADIYAGYNRPHSGAIRQLRRWCMENDSPLTMSCFISGHVLDAEHWYRDPNEGTRICGNVGHWLDLAVHVLLWGELPNQWRILIAWSNEDARDEDLSISLTSERGDLVSVVLTARTEPFEGINESISVQWGHTIAKIDDFRRMAVWRMHQLKRYRYWPKDVGHGAAIMQPFEKSGKRDWGEVELSTMLMLQIAEMVVERRHEAHFSFSDRWSTLGIAGDQLPLVDKLWTS